MISILFMERRVAWPRDFRKTGPEEEAEELHPDEDALDVLVPVPTGRSTIRKEPPSRPMPGASVRTMQAAARPGASVRQLQGQLATAESTRAHARRTLKRAVHTSAVARRTISAHAPEGHAIANYFERQVRSISDTYVKRGFLFSLYGLIM